MTNKLYTEFTQNLTNDKILFVETVVFQVNGLIEATKGKESTWSNVFKKKSGGFSSESNMLNDKLANSLDKCLVATMFNNILQEKDFYHMDSQEVIRILKINFELVWLNTKEKSNG